MRHLIASACVLLTTHAASAGVVTFDGGNGGTGTAWSVGANWDTGNVPTHDDRAVIPGTFDVVVAGNFTVDTIEIAEGASLTIESGNTLTLQDDDDNVSGFFDPDPCTGYGGDNSVIDGYLFIEGSLIGGTGGTLAITNCNHTLSGDGYVRGQERPAQITVASGRTLINALDVLGIVGDMSITGAGTLRNDGILQASGTLIVETAIRDSIGAQWVVGCKSFLVLETGSLLLDGDFTNDGPWGDGCGDFVLYEPTSTCGTFRRDCGNIDLVGLTAYFEYAAFQDLSGGQCSNPAGSGSGSCTDPWLVSTDETGCMCGS